MDRSRSPHPSSPALARTARRRAAALRLLAEVGRRLAASLDVEATLAAAADLAVPDLADWCVVYLVADEGVVQRLAVAGADPTRVETVRSNLQGTSAPPMPGDPVGRALATGTPVLVPAVHPAMWRTVARDADHLAFLEAFGPRSQLVVPLVARGRTIGALSLLMAESGRRFAADDVAVAEEVAHLAALALDNARLYAEARAALAARDAFFSVAAHELKTPVTSLKGHAQLLGRLLERDEIDRTRLARAATAIANAADRLAALTADLLDVARVGSGQLALRPEPIDLATLVEAVVDRQRDALGHSHRLVARLTVRPCPVVVDPGRLEQVLVNLLDNAVKYSPDGGAVTVTLREEAGGALLTVADEGIGLPSGVAEAIFEPFGRASNATAHALPGTGLGLAICRSIVERHGGWIRAESAGEGRGTTIATWLPGAASPTASGQAAAGLPPGAKR